MITGILKSLSVVFGVCFYLWPGPQETFCQKSSTLVGSITDSLTRNPVADASIVVAGTTLGASANSAGRYTIRGVPQGLQTIVCKHIAYSQTSITVLIPTTADTIILNVSLSPRVLPLPGVTATSQDRLHQIFRDSVYRRWARVVVSAKQIEEEALIDFDQFLHWHAPFAEGDYDLFLDGSRFPRDLRHVINIRDIKEIYVWRRIDAPVEFTVGPGEPEPPDLNSRRPQLPRYVLKHNIILIRTKW